MTTVKKEFVIHPVFLPRNDVTIKEPLFFPIAKVGKFEFTLDMSPDEKDSQKFRFFVHCRNTVDPESEWEVTASFDTVLNKIKIDQDAYGSPGNSVFNRSHTVVGFSFVSPELTKYIMEGTLEVELKLIVDVPLRRFDDPQFSDVTVIVEKEKFLLSKAFLAANCGHFKKLFGESEGMEEVTLKDVNRTIFKYLLETLLGERILTDENVYEIGELAFKLEATSAHRACEYFLMNENKVRNKELFIFAIDNGMNELKKEIISRTKDVYDMNEILPHDLNDLSLDNLIELFKHSLELESSFLPRCRLHENQVYIDVAAWAEHCRRILPRDVQMAVQPFPPEEHMGPPVPPPPQN